MTMNFKIEEFEGEPFLKIGENHKCKYTLDWVSHGNYAIRSHSDYLGIEGHHFNQIIESFSQAVKPSKRIPFWKGIVPVRGMGLFEHLIEAYAINNDFLKLIVSTCSGIFGPDVVHYHAQMIIPIETFKQMSTKLKK